MVRLKPVQIWFQGWRRIQRLADKVRTRGAKAAGGELPEFTFLNTTAQPKGWNDDGLELLWRYNLHYFDWLKTGDDRGLVARWIRENPQGSFPGWDPYPTSLRLVNWVKWRERTGGRAGEVEQSIEAQGAWLRDHLEYHLLANHLLANAKALVFAGKYLGRADWYRKGMAIFRAELPEETCKDGVNFERSPMYHAIILEDMLDLWEYTGEGLFREYAGRMLSGLRLVTGPDGKIAKFNDSTEGIASDPAELSARAKRLGVEELADDGKGEESGFLRLEAGEWTMLAKGGEIGPKYQPGHAHADTWSFELWRGDRKLVGDTGCSTYLRGVVRDYERGTKAHNTVIVDGENSSEVWASHRVGRRFDGRRHRREFELSADGLKATDLLGGKGRHEVEVRFHLMPGVGREEVKIECPGEETQEECEFATGWNRRACGKCVIYRMEAEFPCKIEWKIR